MHETKWRVTHPWGTQPPTVNNNATNTPTLDNFKEPALMCRAMNLVYGMQGLHGRPQLEVGVIPAALPSGLGIYFGNGSGICFQNSNVTCGNSLGLSILPPEKGRYIISKIGERLSETRGCVQYTQQAHTWLHATHWPRDGRATHIKVLMSVDME